MIGIMSKLYKAVLNPHLVWRYLKNKLVPIIYRFGISTTAFKPTCIKLYINNACNASCLMCDIGQRNIESVFYQRLIQDEKQLITLEECQKLLNDIKGYHPSVEICGVEPLMHKDILEITRLFTSNGFNTSLCTNGILLPRLAEDVVRSGIDKIGISLDGLEDVHNSIRGSGVYQKALTGIQLLRKYRSEAGKKSPQITVNFCITNFNYHTLVKFAESMLVKEGVDRVQFIHPYYVLSNASAIHNERFSEFGFSTPVNTSSMDLRQIDFDVLWEQIQQIRKYKDNKVNFNIDIKNREQLYAYYNNPDIIMAGTYCYLPWIQATITAQGDVLINNRCFAYKMGNIHENSFNDIWNGEKYRTFRRKLKEVGLFPVCSRCCGSLIRK